MEPTSGSSTGSTPATGQNTAQPREDLREAKGKAQQAAQQVKGKAQQTAQKLKEQGKQRLETGKEGAAEKVTQVADAINRASDELHQQQQDGLADYASQLASGIDRFADTLRNRSIDDLISDTEQLARRNPTLFFIGSIGVGLALSRFLKASAQRNSAYGQDEWSGSQDLDVSYDQSSEWRQPEASQSVYGGQPPSTAGDGTWSTEARDGDFEVREGGSPPPPSSGWTSNSDSPDTKLP